MPRDDDAYLLDMLLAARDGVRFATGLMFAQFEASRLQQYAILKAIREYGPVPPYRPPDSLPIESSFSACQKESKFGMNASVQEENQRTLMCYLDEKYADQGVSRRLQVTSITGVYVPAGKVVRLRRRLYSLVRDIFLYDVSDSRIPSAVLCHASELFKDAEKSDGTRVTDQDRLDFLKGLVSIVNDMDMCVVRSGYRRNDSIEGLSSSLGKDFVAFEKEALGAIFSSFWPPRHPTSHDAKSERSVGSSKSVVFYCIEDDGSPQQRRIFPQNTSYNMWIREFLGAGMSVDFDQIGGVLSYTKGDALGVLPD